MPRDSLSLLIGLKTEKYHLWTEYIHFGAFGNTKHCIMETGSRWLGHSATVTVSYTVIRTPLTQNKAPFPRQHGKPFVHTNMTDFN